MHSKRDLRSFLPHNPRTPVDKNLYSPFCVMCFSVMPEHLNAHVRTLANSDNALNRIRSFLYLIARTTGP